MIDKNDNSAMWNNLKNNKTTNLHMSVPMLFSSYGHNIWMENNLKGTAAFLILGGPSFANLLKQKWNFRGNEKTTEELLRYPGFVTMGVNNSVRTFRPDLWTCVDDPQNFISSIWLDPKITKFVPLSHAEKNIFDNVNWKPTPITVAECPNTLFYKRNEQFTPSSFLTETSFNWGQHSATQDDLGNKGGRSVMLVALRLLYYLGIRKIFLLGCDFKMTEDYNYHFEQKRSQQSIKGNMGTYSILKRRFNELKELFSEAGLQIFNCYEQSDLKEFPFIPFDEALEIATLNLPDVQNERTEGLYDRKEEEKKLKIRDESEMKKKKIEQLERQIKLSEADLQMYMDMDEEQRIPGAMENLEKILKKQKSEIERLKQ